MGVKKGMGGGVGRGGELEGMEGEGVGGAWRVDAGRHIAADEMEMVPSRTA